MKDTFRPISNPYIVGNPIDDRRMFFGREDDFEYIRKRITGADEGCIIVLCGARRSGKTSILFQLRAGRLGDEFIPVLIDMQSMTVTDDADFLKALAREIILAMHDPAIAYDEYFASTSPVSTYSAFGAFATAVGHRIGTRRLVLMFDEYELFETYIDGSRITPDVLHPLATWMEYKKGSIFIIFTGSDRLQARRRPYWERFLTKSLHRRISFLSPRDTLRLIIDPVRDSVKYDSGVPEEILHLTGGQPFYTQVFCQSLVDHLNDVQSNVASMGDIGETLDAVVANPLPQMIFAWSSLSPVQRIALSLIAERMRDSHTGISCDEMLTLWQQEKLGYALDANKLREGVELLFHADLLSKDQDASTYGFRMGLWEHWVRRDHSIYQVLDEVTGGRTTVPECLKKTGEMDRAMLRRPVLWIAVSIGLVAAVWMGVDRIRQRLSSDGRVLTGDEGSDRIAAAMPSDSSAIVITSTPLGASVFLGDRRIGKTVTDTFWVPAGDVVLRLEMAGYRDVVDTLHALKDQFLQHSYDLELLTGTIEVTTVPPGAAVHVDGQMSPHRTPALLQSLPTGIVHEIRVTLPGYGDGVLHASAYEDSAISVTYVFARSVHRLDVKTIPPRADVYLDGILRGKSPLPLTDVTTGHHTVEGRREAYRATALDIEVPLPGDSVSLALRRLAPGSLVIQVNPYADVIIDGAMVQSGVAHFTDTLSVGTHSVLLRHPLEDRAFNVRIQTDSTTTIVHDFGTGSRRR